MIMRVPSGANRFDSSAEIGGKSAGIEKSSDRERFFRFFDRLVSSTD
jgi:hypothetical protein